MATSQFTTYYSSDTSAPVLNGQSGSLNTVLNAILVTGYGSKPAAGWTLEFTSSNTYGSCFRPASGSRFYLSVDDGAPFTVKEARLRGLEVATSWNSGSGQFPVGSAFEFTRKSNTNDTTARPWIAFADAYTMYFFADQATNGIYYVMAFGDIYSFKTTADDYRCLLLGHGGAESTTTTGNSTGGNFSLVNAADDGMNLARTYGGGGVAVAAGKHAGNWYAFTATSMIGLNTYPNPENNAVYMSPVMVHESTIAAVRGKMRGLYYLAAPLASLSDGETFSGSNSYVGKVFQVVQTVSNGGRWVIEISNTVDTND